MKETEHPLVTQRSNRIVSTEDEFNSASITKITEILFIVNKTKK